MTTPIDFYLEQAAVCGRAAEDTMLPNQKEIFLRSQQAWQEMAERKQGVVAGRAEREGRETAVEHIKIGASA